jgi:CMP/dCMP kinase
MAIITLARECGCGGEEIALEVARTLGYACIDRRLTLSVAREAHADEAAVHECDERGQHPILHLLMKFLVGQRHLLPGWGMEYAWSDQLEVDAVKRGISPLSPRSSRALFESAIRAFGEQGNVVIVGRGAGIVLAHHSHVLSVMLRAPLEYRLRRVMQEEGVERDDALRQIQKVDTWQTRYIEQSYGVQWDDASLYHLLLDTGKVGEAAASWMIGNAALELDAGKRGG